MEFTGERFIPLQNLMNDEIAFEHLHRYHKSLKIVEGKTVLDIACGEGYGSSILAQKAYKIIGVDIDRKSIEHAKKTYIAENLQFLEGSVTRIPIQDNFIDIVISYETIEHIDESAQKIFLSEVRRVLKDDGFLIISTPDKKNYTDRYSYINEFHIKEFNKNEFIEFLKAYFKNISTYSQGYEIVDAITGENPESTSNLEVINWPRDLQPFARKYILAICTNASDAKPVDFSSLVFQVSKNYLDLMDGIVKKEAHILELGKWGKELDKEIQEKNTYIVSLQSELETLERLHQFISSLKKEILDKDAYIGSLRSELDILPKLQETINNLNEEKNSHLASLQSGLENIARLQQAISSLKDKIEESSIVVKYLDSKNREQDTIIQRQRDAEASLHLQIGTLQQNLNGIYNSKGWKLIKLYYKLKAGILNRNSRGYKILKKTISQPGYSTGRLNIKKGIQTGGEPTIFETLIFPVFENPLVSIIIPVFNGWEMTYKCLRSVYENTILTSFEVIIADDGATDETRNIENYIKNIKVIRNEENLGFLNNCNNAAQKAKGKYILFLNNDTEVRPQWLSSLTDLLEKDESVGMAGSKLIYPDGRLQEAGGMVWNDASAWNFGHHQDPTAPQFNYLKEVDYISGASIIIRANLWREIGGFDTRYSPAYCEDSDLAFEIRKRGFKVVYQPLSEVIHYEGYSHGLDGQEGAIKEYQKLNNLKLKEKWHDVLQKEHFPNGENVFWARDRSKNKRTILVIDHYVPHYDKDAGSKTTFQYLDLFVSMNFNVKFIGDNFYHHVPYTTTLQQMGIEVLYGSWYAENWTQWIKDNHDKFDYVLLNRPHIATKYIDFIRECTRAKILYYGHDLHFVREMEQYKIEKNSLLLSSAEKWKEIEINIFKKSDLVLTPSIEESQQVKALGIESVLPIKPYIFSKLSYPIKDFSRRNNIFFIGGFSHSPNIDAVLWFVNEIFPIIRRQIPSLKFIIAGSNPPDQITRLANDHVEVLGYLSEEELERVYKEVKIAVIPLRFGAGVKGKTIEGMYNGIPIVTTSFGIEGLPGLSSFVPATDNAEDFSQRVTHLYNSTNEELINLSENGSAYINEHFHLEIVKSEMLSLLSNLKSN